MKMSLFQLGKQLSSNYPYERQEGALYALRLLTCINLLNYADRYVLAAIKSDVEDELNINLHYQTRVIYI